MSTQLVQLTNYDDWEAFYLRGIDGKWKCVEQTHHVRLDDLLPHLGIELVQIEAEFDDHAPSKVTNQQMQDMLVISEAGEPVVPSDWK
jgi:hypothetical protein